MVSKTNLLLPNIKLNIVFDDQKNHESPYQNNEREEFYTP